jgi:hypothetical protein
MSLRGVTLSVGTCNCDAICCSLCGAGYEYAESARRKAMPTYLKYDTAPGFRPKVSDHWIEIASLQYGISRSVQTGGESDRQGKIAFGEITPWKIAPFSLTNVAIINSLSPPRASSGNGLQDIVRLSNGEICYWPKLGYGPFGAKVTTGGAPPSQPAPQRRQSAPVPYWLQNFLLWLRPRMRATGTVHIGGFEFDEKELSLLAGVPVRKPYYR